MISLNTMMDWIISSDMRGDRLDILLSSVIGYVLGSATVLFTMYLLSDKDEPVTSEYITFEDEPEMSPEDKRWLEEMQELWNYTAKGGEMIGNKEDSRTDL